MDAVFVEATYGPISRKAAVREQPAAFRRTVAEAVAAGGVTWIPCFALERTQRVFYELHVAQRAKLLPERLPIYCPSPTAREVTAVYNALRPRGWFSPAMAADADAFSPQEVLFRQPPEKRLPRPCVIISTGDLLVAPWMRRLLGSLLAEPSTNILLVGYQPAESAGETAFARRGHARRRRAGRSSAGEGPLLLVFLRPCRRLRNRRLAR